VPTLIAKNFLTSSSIEIKTLPIQEFREQYATLAPLYSWLNDQKTIIFDPGEVLCSSSAGCKAIDDNQHALYWDSHHLTAAGSSMIVDQLLGRNIFNERAPVKSELNSSSVQ